MFCQSEGADSASLLSDQFQNLQTSVQSVNLRQGLLLLLDQSLQVAPSFQEQLQKFGAESQTLDFAAAQDAMDTINRWARDRTGDQVQQLVSRLEPQTQLLLATTASYQGGWLRGRGLNMLGAGPKHIEGRA